MNIKVMRNVHMYLGCFFAPLLLFFIISGSWQLFELQKSSKGGYIAPDIIKSFSQIHTDQRFSHELNGPAPSVPFRYLALVMCVGILATTVLGILLAFKYSKAWLVWVCLFVGALIPGVMIWLGRSH